MSVYNVTYNVLFIHVPRTAGTSMETAGEFLGSGGHMRAVDYYLFLKRRCRGIDWDGIFKFAFIRNPLDRFVSAYHYSKETRGDGFDGFDDFVHRMSSWNNNYQKWPVHFRPQWWFLVGRDGDVLVDFIGRYEHLEHDWKHVCERVGVETAPLGHRLEGKHRYYEGYYVPETLSLVEQVYERDVNLWKDNDGRE